MYDFETLNSQQEIYDYVCMKLWEQGEPSFTIGKTMLEKGIPICKYRGDNGNKCAIGHLIPDDSYDPIMENKIFDKWFLDNISKRNDMLLQFFKKHKIEFFRRMQQELHDNYLQFEVTRPFRQFLEEHSEEFAKRFKLIPHEFPS